MELIVSPQSVKAENCGHIAFAPERSFCKVFLTSFETIHTFMLRSRWDLNWDYAIYDYEMRIGMHNGLYVEKKKYLTSPVTFVLGIQKIDRENVF